MADDVLFEWGVPSAPFSFATAGQVVFGPGTQAQIGVLTATRGTRVLLVTGADTHRAAPILDQLVAAGLDVAVFAVPHEPTVALAVAGAQQAHDHRADVVVACGGGSVLDAGKAIAALARNPGDPLDYLEIIGRAQPLTHDPLPVLAMPTTAGTGSEVTMNAVLAAPEQRVKVSLRHPRMLPTVAIVDPTLTHSLSPQATAYGGLDALAQVLEPYTSVAATPFSDALAQAGLRRVGWALPRAYVDGTDADARTAMAFVSVCGGVALANAKLGAAHGFAGPLGGRTGGPHGALVAALLPACTAANIAALRAQGLSLARYDQAARWLVGQNATADDLTEWLAGLCRQMAVPGLAHWGMAEADISEVVAQASRASSMKGNPVVLDETTLTDVLQQAMHAYGDA